MKIYNWRQRKGFFAQPKQETGNNNTNDAFLINLSVTEPELGVLERDSLRPLDHLTDRQPQAKQDLGHPDQMSSGIAMETKSCSVTA